MTRCAGRTVRSRSSGWTRSWSRPWRATQPTRKTAAALAEEVAVVLPWHAERPPEIAGQLTRLIRHLGGDDALLRWLDEHPGRPRAVARAYRLAGLLDGISASRAVVT